MCLIVQRIHKVHKNKSQPYKTLCDITAAHELWMSNMCLVRPGTPAADQENAALL